MPPQKRKRIARWVRGMTAGALALTAVSCTSGQAEEPANPTATSSSATGLPSTRPPIPRPLDATAYRDNPCALFSDDQAEVLGIVKPGSPLVKPESADCQRFSSPPGENDLVVSYYFATDLLGRIYQGDTNWPTKNSVEPLTVAGQPAVRTTLPTTDNCRVAIGLADNQGIEIQVRNKIAEACPRAVQVAEVIIRGLGG